MHRILVAYDGSDHADMAASLVSGLPWEEGSVVRVVTVAPKVADLRRAWVPLALADATELERRVADGARETLARGCDRLAQPGLVVESRLARGRPPQAIAREAASFDATLVVVGSRGLGPIEGSLLGSVSAEVVDTAPCPVLVARGAVVRGIVLATDGSPSADGAERYLATLPFARRVPVSVVSVGEVLGTPGAVLAPVAYGRVLPAYEARRAAMEQAHGEIAAGAAERLRAAGVEARAMVAIGDPAAELLMAVRSAEADLVVVGTRGRTGLRRLVLGSTARRVLRHAPVSVLVVREHRHDRVVGTGEPPGGGHSPRDAEGGHQQGGGDP